MTQNAPHAGEKKPLNHSLKARQRIIVGLSWDAREDEVSFLGRLTKKDSQHDLDISCYIYNTQGEFIDYVGAEAQDSMDESGKIYHSGDDMSGEGDGDDESISIELGPLPADVHGIVFLVEVRSNHVFADVDAPFARLADGMTNTNLLETPIDNEETQGSNAFVMCAVYRSGQSDSGWMLYNINEYPDVSQIEDWGSYLAQYTG